MCSFGLAVGRSLRSDGLRATTLAWTGPTTARGIRLTSVKGETLASPLPNPPVNDQDGYIPASVSRDGKLLQIGEGTGDLARSGRLLGQCPICSTIWAMA